MYVDDEVEDEAFWIVDLLFLEWAPYISVLLLGAFDIVAFLLLVGWACWLRDWWGEQMNECGYSTGSLLLLFILLRDEDVWRFKTEILPSLRAKVDVF